MISVKDSVDSYAILFHLQQQTNETKDRELVLVANPNDIGDWYEDNRRIFSEQFKNGLTRLRVQMFRLSSLPLHHMLYVEAINMETDDWVFGCRASETNGNQRFW